MADGQEASADRMLTNRGKYALKALVHLSRVPAGHVALASDIAVSQNIPKRFLDAILNDLRNANFVRAKKGPGGGYMLARPAQEINAGNVIRSIDGPLAPIACASQRAFKPCGDCADVDHCVVRGLMIEVRDAIAGVLEKTNLAELAERANSPGELMYHI
jgi:Rrf2 family protein